MSAPHDVLGDLASVVRDGLLVSMGLDSLRFHRGIWTATFRTKLLRRTVSSHELEALFARVVAVALGDALAVYERDSSATESVCAFPPSASDSVALSLVTDREPEVWP